jgi:hypothetical protein
MGFNAYFLSAADVTAELNEQMPAVAQAYHEFSERKIRLDVVQVSMMVIETAHLQESVMEYIKCHYNLGLYPWSRSGMLICLILVVFGGLVFGLDPRIDRSFGT